ncbi:MAG: hypothetical protein Q9220_005516 [cf. Caloplaca sp. 1 TL-2023]
MLTPHAATLQASTLTFSVHQTSSRFTIYDSDQKIVAYTAVTPSGFINPFSKIPTLRIYRGQGPTDTGKKHVTASSTIESLSNQEPIATAEIAKYTTSISLTVNDRPINVPSRTTGLWKYARGWQSSQGMISWKYGRFSSPMDLAADDEKVLGQWQTSQGEMGRIAGLWLCDVEEKERSGWIDEVVSIALAIYVAKKKRK